jgi:carbon monoxide dehydrogenase subunit G
MQITGTNIIAAPSAAVWSALNDPEVLRNCLPGCESLERVSPEEFRIVILATVGPLKARFNGKLRITDAEPNSSCVLHFEGQGGAMGFGKGTSTVSLREVPQGTELNYAAEAQVGGKLAQVGSRLIDGVARKMSDDFFNAFRDQLSPEQTTTESNSQTAIRPQSGLASLPYEATARSVPKETYPTRPIPDAPSRESSATPLVPAWWLAPAVALGAFAAIAGILFAG